MRLAEGIKVRKVAGQTLLVPVGKSVKHIKKTAALNETAAYIVSLMKEEFTVDEIVAQCLTKYKVEEEILRRDVNKVIGIMKEAGMIVDDAGEEEYGNIIDEAEDEQNGTHTISGTVLFRTDTPL